MWLAIYAAVATAGWVIVSIGGRDQRDQLRAERDKAIDQRNEHADARFRLAVALEQAERDAAGWVRLLTAVEGEQADVIEFPAGGRG